LTAKSWADCEKDHLLVEPKVDLLAAMVSDQIVPKQLLGYAKVKTPTDSNLHY
jgi:hypothetical protein